MQHAHSFYLVVDDEPLQYAQAESDSLLEINRKLDGKNFAY